MKNIIGKIFHSGLGSQNQNKKTKNRGILVWGQNHKRIILSLVFLCAIFITIGFLNNAKAQYQEGDVPFGESYNYLYNSFSGTQDSSSTKNGGSSGGLLADAFLYVINVLLYTVFKIVALIMVIAGVLFDWSINAGNFHTIMISPAIQDAWRMIRDIFNVFFILVLLFSAFCTIFQVEKYNFKKILLTLVIMALLVNFSFPISRFIIDAANIPMYYFFQTLANSIGSNSLSQAITNTVAGSGLQSAILPGINGYSNLKFFGAYEDTFKLLGGIIFIFLFGITLLVIAVLFIIRIVVLIILIIFSPIGFVAAIFPAFSKYADDWWTALFKQSFFGPIMAFMLYISVFIMNGMSSSLSNSLHDVAESASGIEVAFRSSLVAGVTLAVPIILLWAGIIAAQKIGAMGAQEVGGRAGKFAKWAGRLPMRGTKAMVVATGVPGGVKQSFDYWNKKGYPGFLKKVPGFRGREKREDTEARIANRITGGKGGSSAIGVERKRVHELVEEFKKLGLSAGDALDKMRSGNTFEKKAAAMYMSEKDLIKTPEHYQAVMNSIGKNEQDEDLRKQVTSKVKKDNRVDFVIEYEVAGGKNRTKAYEDNLQGMSPGELAGQWALHEDANKHPEYVGYLNKLNTEEPNYFRSLIANNKLSLKNKKIFRDKGLVPGRGASNNNQQNFPDVTSA